MADEATLRERLRGRTVEIDPGYLDELERMGALPECEIRDETTKRHVIHGPVEASKKSSPDRP